MNLLDVLNFDIGFVFKSAFSLCLLIIAYFFREYAKDQKKINERTTAILDLLWQEIKDIRKEQATIDKRVERVETRQEDCPTCPG